MKIPRRLIDKVLVEAGHRCAICLQPASSVHHIMPAFKGGQTTEDNLIALCPNCHQNVYNKKITPNQLRLYKKEWLKQRIVDSEKKKCIVLMTYSDKSNKIYNITIRPIIRELGFEPIKPEDFTRDELYLGGLLNIIKNSSFVIADLSDMNPNITYELGLCDALGKRTILISRSRKERYFDIAEKHIFFYDFTVSGQKRLKIHLKNKILSGKVDIKKPPASKPEELSSLIEVGEEESELMNLFTEINESKGRKREKMFKHFIEKIFSSINELDIIERSEKINGSEIDFVIWNNAINPPFNSLSNPIIVECKAKSVHRNDVAAFINKVRNRGVKTGILFTLGKLTKASEKLLIETTKQGLFILIFDEDDIQNIIYSDIRNYLSNMIKLKIIKGLYL